MRLPLPLPIPLTRLFGPGMTILGVLAIGYLLVTGRLDLKQLAGRLTSAEDVPVVEQGGNLANTNNLISIASFNVQVFGEKKASNTVVMRQLADLCSYFDVIAIQEVRSPQAQPIQNLVKLINSTGYKYDAIISQQIGRTTQKEQYAFIYNTATIRLTDPTRAYVIQDPDDRMHREPFIVSFTAIPTRDEQTADRAPFSFTLINAHTDPDEVRGSLSGDNELNVLADTYVNVRDWEYRNYGEDDFILLGDLNAERHELQNLSRIPGLTSVCDGTPTNTAGTKEWDHILVDVQVTGEFVGIAQVVDYEKNLGLTREQALAISDHRPIWAQFSAFELPPYDKTLATTNTSTGSLRK